MATLISTTFLRDVNHGGSASQPGDVGTALGDFISRARKSVHVAIYDFRLSDALAAPVVEALKMVASNGADVRIAYDASKPSGANATQLAFIAAGADPAPQGTAAWLEGQFSGTSVQLEPISTTSGHLMHDKFVIRDGQWVWTGSTNFTDDAWTHQENNIIQLDSTVVAAAYVTDFEELWQAKAIKSTGTGDTGSTTLNHRTVQWAFSPGEGTMMDAQLATLIQSAGRRIAIASMVITSHAVLAALVGAINKGMMLSGIYDGGEMHTVEAEWARFPTSAPVLANWDAVKAHLVAKQSTPYTANGTHDFMHNKVLVCDDTVATGSYNFSTNAEGNAENQLVIHSPTLADTYAEYIGQITQAYSA